MKTRKPKTKVEMLLDLIQLMRQASCFSCSHPIEYDLGEYEACRKCAHCKARFTLERYIKRGLI